MPTQSTTYNTRLTDEALEKRFRDTFRSQSGAELVDDLYASGVIVPVVDFTAAAEGSALRADLQTAWDFSTGSQAVNNASQTVISTPGFWKIHAQVGLNANAGGEGRITLTTGITNKRIRLYQPGASTAGTDNEVLLNDDFVVFVRSGDSIVVQSTAASLNLNVQYRQIADVYGNLTQPQGYVSS